jgi:hypothetical protein
MLETPDDIQYTPIVTYNPVLITRPDHPLSRRGAAPTRGPVHHPL